MSEYNPVEAQSSVKLAHSSSSLSSAIICYRYTSHMMPLIGREILPILNFKKCLKKKFHHKPIFYCTLSLGLGDSGYLDIPANLEVDSLYSQNSALHSKSAWNPKLRLSAQQQHFVLFNFIFIKLIEVTLLIKLYSFHISMIYYLYIKI